MSRYTTRVKIDDSEYNVAYGFDRMIPNPGYFIEIFTEVEDEYFHLVNEGYSEGVSKSVILSVLEKYDINIPEKHLDSLILDLPF